MTSRTVVAGLVLGLAMSTAVTSSAAALTPRVSHQAVTIVARPPVVATLVPVASRANLCSSDSDVAAAFIVPPSPFKARIVSIRRMPMPPTSSVVKAAYLRFRLYSVTFRVLVGNAVLPPAHTYTQFAYVGQRVLGGRWCLVGGGSGP
jgi:hypothetical protein